MKKTVLILSAIFMFLGVLVFVIIAFNERFFDIFRNVDGDAAANVGSFSDGIIGSIFSLIGVLLVIYSILLINEETQKNNAKEYFFKMLDYHSENVRALDMVRTKGEERLTGKQAMSMVTTNVKTNYWIVNKILEENNYKMDNFDIARLVYDATMDGLMYTDAVTGMRIRNNITKYPFIVDVLQKMIDEFNRRREEGTKLNRGYRVSLSSYYRNLLELLKLLDSNKVLSQNEKQDLVNIFKAQLSNTEGFLLFLDSISFQCGDVWQKGDFVNKYNLIDFVPDGYWNLFNPQELLQQARKEYLKIK